MKTQIKFLTILIAVISLSACENNGDKEKDLRGIIFKDKNEIPQLNGYEKIAGAIIHEDNSGNDEVGISHFLNKNKNILFFEKIIHESNGTEIKYQILDTININDLKKDEYITYCRCTKDTISDTEIVAVVVADPQSEFLNHVVKAWRADTHTGKISPINDIKGIKCNTDGYEEEDDD